MGIDYLPERSKPKKPPHAAASADIHAGLKRNITDSAFSGQSGASS
jgi:hypothetical protein